jgi:hypothetical protein
MHLEIRPTPSRPKAPSTDDSDLVALEQLLISPDSPKIDRVGTGVPGLQFRDGTQKDVTVQIMRKKKERERIEARRKYLEQQKAGNGGNGGRVLMSDLGPIDAAQLRTNANHEAGHAVIMTRIAHGCEVTTVDPQEVKRLTGRAMPGFTKPVAKPLDVDTYLCTALSGITSEAMFGTGFISKSEDDLAHAEEILDRAGLQGEERKARFLAARIRTQKLIAQYKDDIVSVSNALFERLTLNGDEVRALLT